MPNIRLLAYAGGTILTALGMGFFVQYGETAPTPQQTVPSSPVQQSILKPQMSDDAPEAVSLVLQDIRHTSATRVAPPPPANPAAGDMTLAAARQTEIAPVQTQPVPQSVCDVDLSARTGQMATVDLDISAPCLGNERVTIHHNGMMFTEVTDADGTLSVNVPALAQTAVFIVQFSDGNGSVVVTKVPDLQEVDRVVLQWSGPQGFQIHAREFGAGYGDTGHAWSGASGATPNGGIVAQLGNPDTLAPHLAEVYTFPSGHALQSGTVALSIEAEVTAANCNRDISAQTLELEASSHLRTRDLSLSMPDCDTAGDFLVLNNLVDDLTIAAR